MKSTWENVKPVTSHSILGKQHKFLNQLLVWHIESISIYWIKWHIYIEYYSMNIENKPLWTTEPLKKMYERYRFESGD